MFREAVAAIGIICFSSATIAQGTSGDIQDAEKQIIAARVDLAEIAISVSRLASASYKLFGCDQLAFRMTPETAVICAEEHTPKNARGAVVLSEYGLLLGDVSQLDKMLDQLGTVKGVKGKQAARFVISSLQDTLQRWRDFRGHSSQVHYIYSDADLRAGLLYPDKVLAWASDVRPRYERALADVKRFVS